MKKVALIGHGGHAKVVRDVVELTGGYEAVAFLDDKYEDTQWKNGIFTGPISHAGNLIETWNPLFFVAIGHSGIRAKLARFLEEKGASFDTFVHPFSFVSPLPL